MKRWRRTAAAAAALILACAAPGSAQAPGLGELMRDKLDHAQALLAAVVLGDHARVERIAGELRLLSEASTWSPLQTAEYLHYASDFRESARALMDAAAARNTDGVSLAYMEMTLNCVQCHKHVRGARRGD